MEMHGMQGMHGGPGARWAAEPGGMGPGTMMAMGPGGGGMGMGMGMDMMGGRHGERLLDRAGASAEQKTQLRQIMEAARADLQPVREAGRALRRQLMALFAQPTVDARAVESLRQQLQANHDQASKRMTQAMLDASRVLTPEQRGQMAARMEQRRGMMQRHRAEREALEGAPNRP
jgi:Spy/CpxP family protein refolding chaperone